MDQLVQLFLYPTQYAVQMVTVQLRHILLREVHPSGKMRLQGGQLGFLGVDLFRQRTAQRGICQRCPLPPFGGDDLHHGFGLGQAHAAVFQCAAGKLAWAGGRSTGQVQRFQQALGHGVAAVD